MNPDLVSLIAARASGVYRCAAAGEVRGLAAPLVEVMLQKTRDKDAFLDSAAKALGFPEYFGHNWDAFYDCLGDVAGKQLVLLLRGASAFARAEPEEFASALDTLADAAESWQEEGRSLLVVVELDAPVLAPELQEVSLRAG